MKKYSSGERILFLRQKLGISQTEMADAIGIWRQNISAWERDTRQPGMRACQRLISLASQYGIDIDFSYLRPDLK